MFRTMTSRPGAMAALVATLCGCGGEQTGPGMEGDANPAVQAAAADIQVPTNVEPASHCDWIPLAEVEAAVGKLAAPPSEQDGCRYTLALPAGALAARQETVARLEKLRAQFNDPDVGRFRGPMGNYHSEPASYAVTLQVNVSGDVAGEMGAGAAITMLGSELGVARDQATKREIPAGWDALLPLPYGFSGRVGHLQISVAGQAPDVPREVAQALAERVRDRIPDQPFRVDSSYYQMPRANEERDPCSLLDRGAAEAVLGPLLVDPFPASSQHPAMALADGDACAYYTVGHHVLSIVPVWSGGKQEFQLNKSMAGLVASVLPQDQTMLKGAWDDAHIAPTGALLFLKGDRMLAVHFRTSSTDLRGAVKLASQIIPQM